MSQTIDYFLVPNSPWTYLGHERFAALAARAGAEVRFKPMDLAQVFPVSGGLPLGQRAPQRQAYRLMELKRFSESLDMPLTIHPAFFPVAADAATKLLLPHICSTVSPRPWGWQVLCCARFGRRKKTLPIQKRWRR